jgi:hypothetical protein
VNLSTPLEVAGLACAVVCAALLGGPAAAFGASSVCLLYLGYCCEPAKGREAVTLRRPAWLKRPAWPQKLRRKGGKP